MNAGIPEAQARAHADAMDEALRESVATKTDIMRIENKIDLAVKDLTLRLGSMIVAGFVILAGIKFFG